MKLKRQTNDQHVFVPTQKIKFDFSKQTLNLFLGYACSDAIGITRTSLHSLRRLMEMTDESLYQNDKEMNARLELAREILHIKLDEGIENLDSIKAFCSENADDAKKDVIKHLDEYKKINQKEIKGITKIISTRIKFAFLMVYKEIIVNEFLRMDTGDYDTLEEIVESVKEKTTALLTDIRHSENAVTNKAFSLKDSIFNSIVMDTVLHASDESRYLRTGIKLLNENLGGGYQPGRFYLWLGVTNSWKSVMLLSTAYWIKKYNRITLDDPDLIPTVLYITNENDIEESVVRLFNMSVTDDLISKYTPEEVIALLREKGGLTLKDGETDLVMRYYGLNEISTSDLYGIIEDINREGRQVICLVLDYIKRIRCSAKANDEREKLANASNELKDLAVRLSIPVITAQQLNRGGNLTIDAAMESGKADLARFLGRGNIAQCWDMLENADWSAILNKEMEKATGINYLTIKKIKDRTKPLTKIDYFNQPFIEGSTIRLVEDADEKQSAARISLATDLVGVSIEDMTTRGVQHAKKRKEINDDFVNQFILEH